jgi:hypothetical protein
MAKTYCGGGSTLNASVYYVSMLARPTTLKTVRWRMAKIYCGGSFDAKRVRLIMFRTNPI